MKIEFTSKLDDIDLARICTEAQKAGKVWARVRLEEHSDFDGVFIRHAVFGSDRWPDGYGLSHYAGIRLIHPVDSGKSIPGIDWQDGPHCSGKPLPEGWCYVRVVEPKVVFENDVPRVLSHSEMFDDLVRNILPARLIRTAWLECGHHTVRVEYGFYPCMLESKWESERSPSSDE